MGAQCCSTDAGNPVEKINSIQVDGESMSKDQVTPSNGFPKDCAVQVTILGAQSLARSNWRDAEGPKEPYCCVEIVGKAVTKVSTPVSAENTRDPSWNYQITMGTYKFPDTLLFTVFDKEFGRYEEHLGKAQLSAGRLEAGKGIFEGQLPLAGVEGISSVPMLNVKVEAVARPDLSNEGRSKSKEPSELAKGRMVRMAIKKKKGQPLGLLLFKTEKQEVIVAEVGAEGAVADYNKGAKVQEQMQVGDLVVEANGLQTEEDIVNELSKSDDIELLVECRAYIFKVTLVKKPDSKLGMEMKFKDGGEPLVIGEVHPGAVRDYNATADEDKKIKANDHIISVNGIVDPKERLEELQRATGTIDFMVRRVFGLPTDTILGEDGK